MKRSFLDIKLNQYWLQKVYWVKEYWGKKKIRIKNIEQIRVSQFIDFDQIYDLNEH